MSTIPASRLSRLLSPWPYLLFTLFACTGLGAEDSAETLGLDPNEALASFVLHDDFELELVAAEPMVQDPVAMEIDEEGRMWVVEMPGYPLNVAGTGRVRMLTDENGDGKADNSVIFADGLVLPTGIMRWKKGIIVTDPPDILYLEDSDGDNVADIREVLVTGFARSNPQHNMNKPIYALDNWIYVANNNRIGTEAYAEQFGDPGSEIVFPGREEPKLGQNAYSRSVRFKPDSFELESLSSASQFGHSFDAWGHYFQNDNSHPGFHEVIAQRYLDRNPDSGVRETMEYIPAYAPKTNVFPITKNPLHQLLTDRGVFTSAAGISFYTGGSFGEGYDNLVFIAEPVHNLVHVDRVNPNGATYSSSRLLEKKEFLASTDSWFRPVNFYVGPDGAMYVVDYYRRIVEHPEWMDDETAKSGKLADGTSQGRIYRITPKNSTTSSWSKGLAPESASVEDLIELLNDKNAWLRINAQRKLLDNRDEELAGKLMAFLNSSATAIARVHTLWMLEELGALDTAHLSKSLRDKSPGVQENAIIIAERHLDREPNLIHDLSPIYNKNSSGLSDRRNFQLLLTLGGFETDEALDVSRNIVQDYEDDPWFLAAARTAISRWVFPNLGEVLSYNNPRESESKAGFTSILAENLVRENSRSDLAMLIDGFLNGGDESPHWWKEAVLSGLLEGIRRTNNKAAVSPEQLIELVRMGLEEERAETSKLISELIARIKPNNVDPELVERASALLSSSSVTNRHKAQIVKLLGNYSPDDGRPTAISYIGANDKPEIQSAAIDVLSRVEGLHQHVITNWSKMTPTTRNKAVSLFMNDDVGRLALLDEIESGRILANTIGWNRRVVLMRDTEGDVKSRARTLLTVDDSENYTENMTEAESLNGHPEDGKLVYSQLCSVCHQVSGENGYSFGPDLSTVRHWPVHHMLQGIANPSKSIADGYEFWLVKKKDGESLTGVISNEDANTVTLRMQGGAELEFRRSELDSIEAVGQSAMPQGLADQLSAQQMADLVAYIKQ